MTLLLNHQDQPIRARGAMICHFSGNCIDHAVEANIQDFFNPDSILKLWQTNNQTSYKAPLHENNKPTRENAHIFLSYHWKITMCISYAHHLCTFLQPHFI
jgi:hypothetical protein